ncbi:MAG: glycosyltransferase, partial [Atribacterota bacterium]|nr:glycosyltransferase [Atribacterota bacterium]
KYLKKNDYDVEINDVIRNSDLFDINPEGKKLVDIMVLQRQYSYGVYNLMLQALAHGTVPIYETDDNHFNLDPTNPAYKVYENENLKNTMLSFLANCTMITVSTETLKKQTQKIYGKTEIRVLPNCIDFDDWNESYKNKKDNGEKVVIGYQASPTHQRDLQVMARELAKIMRTYPNVYLKCIGWAWTDDPIFAYDFEPFKDRIIKTGYCQPHDMAKMMLDIDICIAPLEYYEFNEAKSNVKQLESGAMGIPLVATDIVCYNETITDNKNGFLIRKNNKTKWYNTLEKLILNPSIRKRVGEASRKYVEDNFNIAYNWQKWVDAYKEAMQIRYEFLLKEQKLLDNIVKEYWNDKSNALQPENYYIPNGDRISI